MEPAGALRRKWEARVDSANRLALIRWSRRGGTILLVIMLLAAVAAIVGAAVYFRSGPSDQDSVSASTADIVPADFGSFEILTLATGELESKERIELRNQLDKVATIVEIIPEGTFVQAGDVLIRLNADAIKDSIDSEELALVEATNELAAARASLEIQISENESKLRKAELAVEIAQLALEQWKAEDKLQIEKLQLDIDQAQRQVDRWSKKYEKNLELIKQKFISQDQFDQEEIAKINADAELTRAQRNLEVYTKFTRQREAKQKQSDLDEARAELERVKQENQINITSRQANVTNRERMVQRREQRLAELRQQYDYCTVVAPSPGLVVYGSTVQSDNWRNSSEGPFQVGRSVGPNDLLIVLPDTSQMVAKVKVHESLAGRIRPGQRAEVKVDAVGNRVFTGQVESVGVMAETGGWRDPNRREYSVRITLDPDQQTDELKPSMRCEAHIRLGTVEDVVHVPVQAVFMDGPVTYVYVPRGGKFARLPVQLGRRSDTRAEIVAGLEAGQPVLVRAPEPGEVISEPWDESQLASAGYILDEQGNPTLPMMNRSRRPGMPGAAPAMQPGRASPGTRRGPQRSQG